MPANSDLSNELLENIIQSVHREDLRSLALSKKWFHALSYKAWKSHLSLKRYSTLSIGGYPGDTHRLHKSYDPEVHEDAADALLLLESDTMLKKFVANAEHPQVGISRMQMFPILMRPGRITWLWSINMPRHSHGIERYGYFR